MKTATPWFQQRRIFLVGLGGLGLMTLMGTSFLFISHIASRPVAPPLIPNEPSKQFFDPTSSNWINRLAWSPDGREIAAAIGASHISIWDLEAGALISVYPTLNGWVNDISWSKASGIAAATADDVNGSIQIWNYPDKTPLVTFRRTYPLRTVAWSPNGAYLAFAGHATTVEVWEPFTPRLVSRYMYPALGSLGISRVKWSSTGTLLVCATDDGTVHVWEALTGNLRIIYRGHQSRVIDVAWSPDGRYIASCGVDKTTRVWEALTGQTMCVYQGQTDVVDGVDWSLKGNYIVSGGADHTAQVWEAFTGRLVAKCEGISGTVETMLWSMDGKMIALGTSTQGIEIWQAPQ
jgi:WD40 repeat protein